MAPTDYTQIYQIHFMFVFMCENNPAGSEFPAHAQNRLAWLRPSWLLNTKVSSHI